MYFGNLRKALYVKDPAPGWDMTPRGAYEGGGLAGGGSFQRVSAATHREPKMAWPQGDLTDFDFLGDFRNGSYGTGLLYVVDDMTKDINALPPHWATPGLTAEGWPSLVGVGQNPKLDYTYTRTNYVIDPNVVAPLNWASLGSATISSQTGSGAVAGNTFGRAVATVAATAYGTNATATFPVVAGEGFALSGYVRGTTARNIQLRITWTGATASSNTAVTIASTTAWQRLTYTGTVPAGATAARVDLVAAATSVAIGNLFEWDNVMYERGTTTVGGYFDGSTVYTDGRVSSWTGVANSSSSQVAGDPAFGLPARSATYNLVTVPNAVPQRGCTLLIPPDQSLWIGFTGVAAAGSVLRVQPIYLDGSYAPTQDLTLLSSSANVRLNTSFKGDTYSAIIIYLVTTVSGGSSITLTSGKAVYTTLTGTPVLVGNHVTGRGMSGMRFKDDSDLTYTFLSLGNVVDKRYATAAASFNEVGAWL